MKKITIIPPITSTGRNRNKLINPLASLAGLANISIGRFMSERKKENKSENFFDVSKFSKADFNKKNIDVNVNKSTTTPVIFKIIESSASVTIDDKFIVVKIEFAGIKFSGSTFDKISNTAIINNDVILSINTIGDIIDYSISIDNKKIYINEIYIPKLLNEYDPSTMNVKIKNNSVIIKYKK
jgi:hypothetical protein